MLKSRVFYKNKCSKLKITDVKTIVLFTLFLCGVIIGINIMKNCDNDLQNVVLKFLKNYITVKTESTFIECFLGTFTILIICVFINYFLGLCAIGTPFIWLIPVCFGLICGACVSAFFLNYGFKGLIYCALVHIPCYAITAATIIRCCCESCNMSIELLNCINKSKSISGNCRNSLYDFTLNHLILCIPVVIAALLSTIGFKLFSGLFIFV